MARGTIVLLLTLAAIVQASIPNGQDSAQIILRRSSLYEQKGKPLCKECEKIVLGMKKAVDDPATEQKLRDSLTKVCNMRLIGRYQQQCFDLLNDIIVVIHQAQSLLDNPTQVCETLKLCAAEAPGLNTATKRMFMSVVSKIVQDAKQPSPLMAADTCGLCTTALGEVKRFLEVPQFVEKIEGELEKACKYLGKFESKCRDFVEQDFGKIFEWIIDALCQPEETCAAIHLCPKSGAAGMNRFNRLATAVSHPHLDRLMANITAIQTVRGFDVGCAACKVTVDAGIKALTRDSVLTSIATDITDLVCKILPSSLRAGCFDFLGIYGKAALELTFTNWTPEEICESMHACKSKKFQQLIVPQIGKSVLGCDACKAVTKTLAFELQQSNVQQDIVNVLTQGCLLIPGKYAFKCGDLVIEYVPFAMGYVADFLSRQDVCSVLHLC